MTTRTAVVTGGSRGIGAAIAERLAVDGYDVAITYARNADAAAQVTGKIEKIGRRALAIQADGGAVDDNISLTAKVVDAFDRLDVLVCNAGMYPYGGPDDTTPDDICRCLDLNLRGAMVESVMAARVMKPGGRIILIGSAFGERAPFPGIALYSATKAGLIGFAKGLARDLGPKGITVNVVQPGPIDTDLNPADGESGDFLRSFLAIPRYGSVEDVAAAVSYLSSEQARYVTGTTLTVDGGLTA